MTLCSICPSLSSLFDFAKCLPGLSMCWKWLDFLLFFRLNNTHFYVCTAFSLSANPFRSWLLWIMLQWTQISLPDPNFISFEYISRSRNARSFGSCIFNFLRDLHTIFCNGCFKLHFHQQCMRVSFCWQYCQHLISCFIIPFWQVWSDMSLSFWFTFLW